MGYIHTGPGKELLILKKPAESIIITWNTRNDSRLMEKLGLVSNNIPTKRILSNTSIANIQMPNFLDSPFKKIDPYDKVEAHTATIITAYFLINRIWQYYTKRKGNEPIVNFINDLRQNLHVWTQNLRCSRRYFAKWKQ